MLFLRGEADGGRGSWASLRLNIWRGFAAQIGVYGLDHVWIEGGEVGDLVGVMGQVSKSWCLVSVVSPEPCMDLMSY